MERATDETEKEVKGRRNTLRCAYPDVVRAIPSPNAHDEAVDGGLDRARVDCQHVRLARAVPHNFGNPYACGLPLLALGISKDAKHLQPEEARAVVVGAFGAERCVRDRDLHVERGRLRLGCCQEVGAPPLALSDQEGDIGIERESGARGVAEEGGEVGGWGRAARGREQPQQQQQREGARGALGHVPPPLSRQGAHPLQSHLSHLVNSRETSRRDCIHSPSTP